MPKPIEIVYQRWWTVNGTGRFSPSEDYPDAETAVRRAVAMLNEGAIYVTVMHNDRPKPVPPSA